MSVPTLLSCSSSLLRGCGIHQNLKNSIPYFGYIFDNDRFILNQELSFLIQIFKQNSETKLPGSNHINNIMSNGRRIAIKIREHSRNTRSSHIFLYMQFHTFTSLYIRARQLSLKIRGFSDLSKKFDENLKPVLHPDQTSARFLRISNEQFVNHGFI